MALPDSTRVALVPAAGGGKETRTTWGAFKADHAEMKPDEIERIGHALEDGIAYQHYPGGGAPVVYIVRR